MTYALTLAGIAFPLVWVLWIELDIRHLDRTRHLETHDAPDLTVNRYDGHPGVLAHRIAADAIFAELLAGDPLISTE